MTTKRVLAIWIGLGFSAMIFSSCTRSPSEPESDILIGRRAPGFTLSDLKGNEVSLDQYKGKIVLLDFWATWCGPCQMTMPLLEKLQKEYSDVMVQVAVNLEEPRDLVRDYVESNSIHAQVLLDQDGSVAEAYGVVGIPRQVLIDKKGVVQYAQTGFNPSIASVFRAEIQKLR